MVDSVVVAAQIVVVAAQIVVVVHLVAPSDVEDPAAVADLLHAAVVAAQNVVTLYGHVAVVKDPAVVAV